MDESVPLFFMVVSNLNNGSPSDKPTSFGRGSVKIDGETDIVIRFWLRLDE